MARSLLLSGATGLIGMELLARYLIHGDRRIVALVRAADDAAAKARIQTVLVNLFGDGASAHAERVTAVAADLTAPDLGLSVQRRDELAEEVSSVMHCAASVSFGLSLPEARAVNLEGTAKMVEFAELVAARGDLERYDHVSTAYVAGTHVGAFREEDLQRGQAFHNPYEQSKFESEQLVRSRDLPATVMRPSIVVGDRDSGWTSSFNVLYWPLRAFERDVFGVVPSRPDTPVDVVSVDYVADAIHALSELPDAVGGTYHLTAGSSATSVEEIVDLASRYWNKPGPRIVSPSEFRDATADLGEATLAVADAYLPYFTVQAVFDNSAAAEHLAPLGIEPSPLSGYFNRLLDFATDTRWGRSPRSRAAARTGADREGSAAVAASD